VFFPKLRSIKEEQRENPALMMSVATTVVGHDGEKR
jgi:hypothetical protein